MAQFSSSKYRSSTSPITPSVAWIANPRRSLTLRSIGGPPGSKPTVGPVWGFVCALVDSGLHANNCRQLFDRGGRLVERGLLLWRQADLDNLFRSAFAQFH